MSGSKEKTDNTSKFYEKVECEYLLDLQGIETHCRVNSDRYDEIYKRPTISYHFTFENNNLKKLGDSDEHTFEPPEFTNGVRIANFKRKPEYRLPFSHTGFKSHFSGFIDMKSIKDKNIDDIVVEISKWIMVDAGIKRKKYFCTKRFADVPIVSIIKKL